MNDKATLEKQVYKKKGVQWELGKRLGPLPSSAARPTGTCSAGQDCSNMWRKKLLSPFLCTARSAIPDILRDTSSTDRPGKWHALWTDACALTNTHSQANHIYAYTQKPQNKRFCPATIGASWNGGGSVRLGGMRAQSTPKPFGAIWHSEATHHLKPDPKVRGVVWVFSVSPSHPD